MDCITVKYLHRTRLILEPRFISKVTRYHGLDSVLGIYHLPSFDLLFDLRLHLSSLLIDGFIHFINISLIVKVFYVDFLKRT